MITEIDISDESEKSISFNEDCSTVAICLNSAVIKLNYDQFDDLVEKIIVYQKALDVSVKFDSNLKGGFGGYLTGSFSKKKPVMKINIASLISLVNDPEISNDESRRAELYKYFLSETLVHELIHIFQEALSREFSEDDIENVLSKVRNEILE